MVKLKILKWMCLSLSLIIPSFSAWGGANPAKLNCLSTGSVVEINGIIPSPSLDETSITLTYRGVDMKLNGGKFSAYVASDFPLRVFTMIIPVDSQPLVLYAIPETVEATELQQGLLEAKFQAKLTAQRPGVWSGPALNKPLKANMNCIYMHKL